MEKKATKILKEMSIAASGYKRINREELNAYCKDLERISDSRSKRKLEEIIKEEKRKITHNLNLRLEEFHEAIEAMAHCKYYNTAAQELYGEKDVASYFLKKHFAFGRV